MKKSYLKYSIIIILFLLVTWIISCSGRSGTVPGQTSVTEEVTETGQPLKIINIISPEEGRSYEAGDNIKISFEPETPESVPDSVTVYFNGILVATIIDSPWSFSYQSDVESKMGRASIKLIAFFKNNNPQTITRFIKIFSNIVPKIYHYKVINVYPHDKEAYTQGLVYDGNYLYEGTGIIGMSDLRKVELKTGNIIKQQKIEDQLFGEGIAILGEKIFQITWTSKVGFVYDKSTFKLINKIYYQTEGWGLSAYKDKLVMSDGSNVIYFFEPGLFTVVSSIEVYDNEKPVNSLNELEVINGEIWANIYQTDLIARIDPNTGKVLSYVDLTGILPQADRDLNTEVLNGIAWDPELNRIFVTGKHWSKLFEIRLIE
jgi:glutaminyl-peptide cyclotransferase